MLEANGFVTINDPHNASKPPRSRLDNNYARSILGKIEEVRDYANNKRMIPLFTGDVFKSPVEISEVVKNRLIDVLYSFWTQKGIMIPGNHDMKADVLGEADSLWNIKNSRSIRVFTQSGMFDKFLINGKVFAVGGTPYGQEIPDMVERDPDVDTCIWLTHHNLPFSMNYKKKDPTLSFKEIHGVDEVFNGHIHIACPSVTAGTTRYNNIGSITRTSVDDSERTPVFGVYDGSILVPMPVHFEKNVFDLSYRKESNGVRTGKSSNYTPRIHGQNFLKAISDENSATFNINSWLLNEVDTKRCSPEALSVINGMLE